MTGFSLFFMKMTGFDRFWQFWLKHRENGSLGLGYGYTELMEMSLFYDFSMKPLLKRHAFARLLHFFWEKHEFMTFWDGLAEPGDNDADGKCHFSLCLNGSQFFSRRIMHFKTKPCFTKRVVKTCKTRSYPVVNTVINGMAKQCQNRRQNLVSF